MNTKELTAAAQTVHDEIDKAMAKQPKQPPFLLAARRAAEMVLGHLGSHALQEIEEAGKSAPPIPTPAPPATPQAAPGQKP